MESEFDTYGACVALNNQENRGINPLSGELKNCFGSPSSILHELTITLNASYTSQLSKEFDQMLT